MCLGLKVSYFSQLFVTIHDRRGERKAEKKKNGNNNIIIIIIIN